MSVQRRPTLTQLASDLATGKVTARQLAEVSLARIADPRLYKAVLGHAALIVSSRMHPLILGAGMGVPLVGLSYNDKFRGLFDQLGTVIGNVSPDDVLGKIFSGFCIGK